MEKQTLSYVHHFIFVYYIIVFYINLQFKARIYLLSDVQVSIVWDSSITIDITRTHSKLVFSLEKVEELFGEHSFGKSKYDFVTVKIVQFFKIYNFSLYSHGLRL